MHAQLMPETLFLTINLIDRFLECKRVSRRNLQLVSGTPSDCCLHSGPKEQRMSAGHEGCRSSQL